MSKPEMLEVPPKRLPPTTERVVTVTIESERMPQKTRDKHIRQVTAVAGIKPWKAEATTRPIRNKKVLTLYFPFDTIESARDMQQKLNNAGFDASKYKPLPFYWEFSI